MVDAADRAGAAACGALYALVAAELAAPVPAPAERFGAMLATRYGAALAAILYYGSCLRHGTEEDGILDLFVLVDDYARAYDRAGLALANRVLPPNVFYGETTLDTRTVRGKYAVVSLDDFAAKTSAHCFHAYFWGRFAQPCTLVFARDATARDAVAATLTTAIETFIARAMPLLPPTFDALTLWRTGLAASYRTELRPEDDGAVARVVEAGAERYRRVTRVVLAGDDVPARPAGAGGEDLYATRMSTGARWLGRQAWRVRRVQGKTLNLLRLMKAVFTFEGGVDYVLWKIERHTGVHVEATPRLRRHPLLACWPLLWRLYRAGALR